MQTEPDWVGVILPCRGLEAPQRALGQGYAGWIVLSSFPSRCRATLLVLGRVYRRDLRQLERLWILRILRMLRIERVHPIIPLNPNNPEQFHRRRSILGHRSVLSHRSVLGCQDIYGISRVLASKPSMTADFPTLSRDRVSNGPTRNLETTQCCPLSLCCWSPPPWHLRTRRLPLQRLKPPES